MISVIIPTRNRKDNLIRTVAALDNQQLPRQDYEIIISDDNSTDNTFEVYTQFKSNGRLKYVNNNTKPHSWNASVPRNLGALIADPETRAYVFVDSDVKMPFNYLQTIVNDLDENSNRVIVGPYHWMAKDGETVAQMDVRWPKFQEVKPEQGFNAATDGLACFGGSIVIPKKIFWDVMGFSVDTHIGLEDGDMGLKLWKRGHSVSYDKRLLGYHQWHETPADRFPADMKKHINKLNQKHFGTDDPDYGIIEASREAYEAWGITGWEPPQEWLQN